MGRLSVPLPCICRSPVNPSIRTSVSERLPSRIVPLIQELRDILLALLPQPTADAQGPDSPIRRAGGSATAAMICETLDPALIAQEVSHRVLDVASLATFFGQILKSHCAPMRDEIVESMVKLIRTGGAENDMTMVSNGLRMCFEILELMKLDIANHQLRMLRPYLLETAADFECRTFMHLREKRPAPLAGESPESTLASIKGPPLSKTKAWVNAIQDRHQQTSVPLKMVDARPLVIDGVLQLLFKPAIDSPDTTVQAKTPVIASSSTGTPVERQRRPKSSALPLTSEVPETLSLDTYRLQLFHGDVVDLCIVHLLLLLYRQLCSMNKRTPSAEDVEIIRRQIWVIMSEINTSAAATPASAARRTTPPMAQSIRKLESETWREGMKDVLLQISRYSATPEGTSGPQSTTVPDAATLSMLNNWMDTNFRRDSKLVSLLLHCIDLRSTLKRCLGFSSSSWCKAGCARHCQA